MALASLGLAPAAAQQAPTCDGRAATIVGTPGNDTLLGTPGDDVIAALQGNDVIRGLGGDDVICGGIGADTIYGGTGFDIIFGAQGDDIIYATNGIGNSEREDRSGSRIFGGTGNDTIYGSNRWDRMQGGQGDDALFGYEGRDWIRAGSGTDDVHGGAGIDDLHGGNGPDTIDVTASDTVRGGAGNDWCNVNGKPASIQSCEKSFDDGALGAFRFEHFAGTAWAGVVYGLVPVSLSNPQEMEGDCYLVVGEATPTWIKRGDTTSKGEAPSFAILATEFMYPWTDCDSSAAEALGYQSIYEIEAPLGTTVRFYAGIRVSSDQGPITDLLLDYGDFYKYVPEIVYLDQVP